MRATRPEKTPSPEEAAARAAAEERARRVEVEFLEAVRVRLPAHPAVVDNLTTCANQEDYVNMGYNAAKKAYDSMHLAK